MQLVNIADNVEGTIKTPLSGTEDEDIAFVQLMRIYRDFAAYGAHVG